MKPSVKPRAWDALVVLAVLGLAAALALLFWKGGENHALTAVLSQDGVEMERVALASLPEEGRKITVETPYHTTILLEKDRVCISETDCPTKDCAHTGWISRAGESIICLPGRLVVELVGEAEFDAVLG